MIFMLYTTAAMALAPIKARYSEEAELVSIAAHLAEVNGYDWSAEDVNVDDYMAEVDSFFAPHKQHPIVTFIREELHNEGFNWHFPMHMALRLNIANGKITYSDRFEANFDGYYDRITPQNEQKLLVMLQDFYDTTGFHDFFASHAALYKECEVAMQRVIDKIDWEWYDRFFGQRQGSMFCIYPNILIGPANYAVHQKCKDGSEVINAVMGCCIRNAKGEISYDINSTLPIIIHECNHSYCNPLNEEFWPQIQERAEAFFSKNAKHYADEAYGNALYVINETFVEACVMRYLMTHPLDFSDNREQWVKLLGISEKEMKESADQDQLMQDVYIKLLTDIDYTRKRFYMIKDVIRVLGEREQKSTLYPTMRDFMPQYIKVINGFSF